MKLIAFSINNTPPIDSFQISDLSNRVVVAGPNGVGKTRLNQSLLSLFQQPKPNPANYMELQATCVEERTAWGKDRIDTRNNADCQLLQRTLHIARRRRNWTSSIVNIESNRESFSYQPFGFDWELHDPDEESVAWQTTIQTLRARSNDTQHAIFKKIFFQRNALGNTAIQRRREGATSMNLHFSDPLEPFKIAFESLLGPKTLAEPDLQGQKLKYNYNETVLDIDQLSSGERQVVNIAFDIILRTPSDCIFIIDEPELHLHPELSYKLIRTLQDIGSNNQFIFFSHSAEIISSSIDDTVIFMQPPKNGQNQAVLATRDDDTSDGLRQLGHSIGVISLGRKIVLIEGEESSTDKKVYGSILGSKYNDLVLLPVGSVKTIQNFASLHDKILSKTIWGVDFFMLCDHDAPYPPNIFEAPESEGRLKRIKRYHVENYFLEEEIIAEAFTSLGSEYSWLRDARQVAEKLREIARERVSYATALIISRHVRRLAGSTHMMPAGCDKADEDGLVVLMRELAESRIANVARILNDHEIASLTRETYQSLLASCDDGDDWKIKIPGRSIFKKFLGFAGIRDAHFKSTYIKTAQSSSNNPFLEIQEIFDGFRGF